MLMFANRARGYPHRYFFRVYALGTAVGLEEGARKAARPRALTWRPWRATFWPKASLWGPTSDSGRGKGSAVEGTA